MSAPQVTRRTPSKAEVAGGTQTFDPNVLVMQLLSGKWSQGIDRPKISGREGWFDGSFQTQICCRPVTHGINRRNVLTIGADLHRRDPIIAIHMFARDPVALSKMRDEVDRIIINEGVNPFKGVQYILPAGSPATTGDYEEKGETATIFHDIYFVEVLHYKRSSTRN